MSELLTEAAPAAVVVDAPAEPVEATVEPAGPEAVATPAPAPPAPAGIDLTDPDVVAFLDARASSIFQSQMEPLIPLLEQVLGGGTGSDNAPPGTGVLDPWDESFGGNLDARFEQFAGRIEQRLDQLTEPLRASEQQKAIAEGEQRLQDVLADDIARNGEFSSKADVDKQARELVRTLAGHVYDGLASRFGGHGQVVQQGIGPRLSEAAMVQASATIRGLLEAERAAGASTEANRLATLASVDGEPPAAAGIQTFPETKARSLSEGLAAVTARHAEALRNGGA